MRILMLSWEFPPRVVGGLARHVEELSAALVRAGHEIHVVTQDGEKGDAAEYELFKGIHVHRIKSFRPKPLNFIDEILHMNLAMLEYAIRLVKTEYFDAVHVHDWLAAHAGITLKRAFGIPLIATIHATEWGRWNGIHNELQTYINNMEWQLNYESIATIVCSYYMKDQVMRLFQVPEAKIFVLPNGIERDKFDFNFDQLAFRRKFVPDYVKIVMSVGRMVAEKGFQYIVDAAPRVLASYGPNVRFIIAGKGGMLESLRHKAAAMGLSDYVWFLGYVDDESLNKLFIVSDVAVFASTYEPFGITAIEAMAAGTPVVVSNTGGLGEIVDHNYTGYTTYAGDPDSLAWGINEMLYNEGHARYMRENAFHKVENVFDWNLIAADTITAYKYILGK